MNVSVLKKVSRSEYDALEDAEQRKIKDGPFVTAACFEREDCPRRAEHAVGFRLALLDFDYVEPDEAAEKGYVNYADQFFDSIGHMREALHPFNHMVYETISSRPNARRIRVLVDCDFMPGELHRSVIAFLAKKLGVQLDRWKGRIESMTLVLPMFRPVQFQGEDNSAVLCSRFDGRPVEELDIPKGILEESQDRNFRYEGDDEIDLMNAPVVGIELSDVEEVLTHVDADDYFEWINVGMALRHQFRYSEEEAQAAYEMWDEWSQKSDNYTDSDQTYFKWQSFTPDATGRAPITIRSVFEKAKAKGWEPAKLIKKVKRSLADWMTETGDPDLLMEEGPARIAAMPFKNDVTEESLVMMLKARIKTLTGQSVDKATLKKSVKGQRRRTALAEDDDIPKWMRPFVFIAPKNTFRNIVNGLEYGVEAYNNTFARELMSLTPDSESSLTGRPTIAPKDFALNIKRMKMVDGTTYDPRQGDAGPFFEYEGRMYLNEYRASTIPKVNPELATRAGRIFRHHVETVVGDKDYAIKLIDWFAHTVQFPGVLIPWVPLIQSCEGSGKTMMARAVGHAIGMPNFKVVGPKAMLSDFNDWAFFCQLLTLEEIKVPGHSKVDVMNTFKDLITNQEVSLNMKFENVEVTQNLANKIAFTNHIDALYLDDSDRRWMPIQSPIQDERQARDLAASGHFKRVAKLYKHGGALRQWFLDWKISEDFAHHGPAPKTRFRKEMIEDSKNDLQREIEEAIEDPEETLIGRDLIYAPAVTRIATSLKNNYKPAHFLRKLGYAQVGKQRPKFGQSRGYVWAHRSRFDTDFGDPFEILKERYEKFLEKDDLLD